MGPSTSNIICWEKNLSDHTTVANRYRTSKKFAPAVEL